MDENDLQKEWESRLRESPTDMPSCPKCGGKMIDDSGFLICGAKCTSCDFSCYDGGLS